MSLVVRPVYNRKIFVYAPVTSDGELHIENMNIFYVNWDWVKHRLTEFFIHASYHIKHKSW